jgi:hypothetical protein
MGSWAAAKKVVARFGIANTFLLFMDTLYEDADSYRFLLDAAGELYQKPFPYRIPQAHQFPDYRVLDADIRTYSGNEKWRKALALLRQAAFCWPNFVWLVEGRDPWEVYRDSRFLGNSRRDPCSRVLKREVADAWLRCNCDPRRTTCYVGIDWTEKHRYDDGQGGGLAPRRAKEGWTYQAPLCEEPYLWKPQISGALEQLGIAKPRKYDMQYAHNNCGGFCCKAGHAHYANRLRVDREGYAYDEYMEQQLRVFLAKEGAPSANYSMLTDRTGDGKKKTLTLKTLRERLERNPQLESELIDYGGCGCFADD